MANTIGVVAAALAAGLVGGAAVVLVADGGGAAPGGSVDVVTQTPSVLRDDRALSSIRDALARLEGRVTELEAAGPVEAVPLSFDDLPSEDLAALRAELRAALEEMRAAPAIDPADVAVDVELLVGAREALDGAGSVDERVDVLARYLDLEPVQRSALRDLEVALDERRYELQRLWLSGFESVSSLEPLSQQAEDDFARDLKGILTDAQRAAFERLLGE